MVRTLKTKKNYTKERGCEVDKEVSRKKLKSRKDILALAMNKKKINVNIKKKNSSSIPFL